MCVMDRERLKELPNRRDAAANPDGDNFHRGENLSESLNWSQAAVTRPAVDPHLD